MYHKIKLSSREKINEWLTLCDFTLDLIRRNMGTKRVIQVFKKMREDKLKANFVMLKNLSKERQ